MVGVTVVVMPTYHVRRNARHGFEAGAGWQGLWGEGEAFDLATGMVAYRYRTAGGFIIRSVGSVWVAPRADYSRPWPGVGVSFGKTF